MRIRVWKTRVTLNKQTLKNREGVERGAEFEMHLLNILQQTLDLLLNYILIIKINKQTLINVYKFKVVVIV